ncbi:hypothetical protein SKAU_G00061730 [Synaphobranchus kaupii]|uniref:CCHC-type domain-containing protein n=1 Tax=Synaphobranchus kaupii TaxID=118154 RepID=A0A9Q1G4Y5_SYNKA|nr:hypothetical protein SKAU_G00061730 [Synaphobranchus kaupii]
MLQCPNPRQGGQDTMLVYRPWQMSKMIAVASDLPDLVKVGGAKFMDALNIIVEQYRPTLFELESIPRLRTAQKGWRRQWPGSGRGGYNNGRGDTKDGLCFYCKKPGHFAQDCRKKKRDLGEDEEDWDSAPKGVSVTRPQHQQ